MKSVERVLQGRAFLMSTNVMADAFAGLLVELAWGGTDVQETPEIIMPTERNSRVAFIQSILYIISGIFAIMAYFVLVRIIRLTYEKLPLYCINACLVGNSRRLLPIFN